MHPAIDFLYALLFVRKSRIPMSLGAVDSLGIFSATLFTGAVYSTLSVYYEPILLKSVEEGSIGEGWSMVRLVVVFELTYVNVRGSEVRLP